MNTTQQHQQQQQQVNQLNPVAKQMTKSISANETTENQRVKLLSKAASTSNSDRVSTSNSSSLSSTGWCLTDTFDSSSSSTHESHPVNTNLGLGHESQQPKQQQNQQGSKTLAFIEAQDNNEMLMVINMLKNQFPHINLHLCSTPNENVVSKSESQQTEIKREVDVVGAASKNYLDVRGKSSSVQSPDQFSKMNCGSPKSDSYQCYRNSLSASHANSLWSIDNSPLSSNNTSFERQESKDSESCFVNKSSFDSGKGLQNGETNPDQEPLQKQFQQAFANKNRFSHNSQQIQPVNFDFEHKLNLNPTNNASTTGRTGAMDSIESRQLLTSPTNISRSSMHNWKKWKKGQAWRYNSSSNLSENSTHNINENSNNSFNANSNNSSFSYEKTEEELLNEQSQTNNNFLNSQMNNSKTYGFSNSFEYETTSNSSNQPLYSKNNSLSQWSSTSQIEKNSNLSNFAQVSIAGEENLKGKKRRGKLMRDQTIDNADEQSTSINCLNPACLNPSCMKESSSSPFLSHNENSLKSSDGSPKNLSRCSSPGVIAANAARNGRVSPPEKRVTLNSNTDLNGDNSKDGNSSADNNKNNDEEIQNIIQKSLSSFYNDKSQVNQLDLSILANMIKNKGLFNNELMGQIIAEQLRQQHTAMMNHHQQQSTSNSPSPCPIAQSSQQQALNNSILLNTVNQLSHLSLRQENMDSLKNSLSQTLANQFEFYQDMVKMGLDSSAKATAADNKQLKFADMNGEILSENRLSPNGKYYMMKNQASASFESSNSQKNCSNSQNKPIYRSNSSPSHSSMHSLALKNSQQLQQQQQQVPLNLYNLEQQQKQAMTATGGKGFSPIDINNNNNNNSQNSANKADKISSSSGANGIDCIFKNRMNESDIFSKKVTNGENDINGYLKPVVSTSQVPEIVITESKMDSYSGDYTADVTRNPDVFKPKTEKQDYYTATNNCFNSNHLLSNSNLFRSSSSDLNKPKVGDLPWINHSISFEEILKANQENSPKNWGLNNSTSSQATSVKSSKMLKPHVCTSCQKRFARSDMLIRHSRLHSGIRPYRCNRCGQEFSRSDHLNTHLRTHTGEKPYSCPHPKCSYAACRKDMITRHLKVHNKNKISMNGLSLDSTGGSNESPDQPVFSNANLS